MKSLVLTVVGLAALTASASAETCSQRMAQCKSINRVDTPGPEGQARCESYFSACMSTGTWTLRKGTFTGLTRK